MIIVIISDEDMLHKETIDNFAATPFELISNIDYQDLMYAI